MAAVSLAILTKLWDLAGREYGRIFLYLYLFLYGEWLSLEPQNSCYVKFVWLL